MFPAKADEFPDTWDDAPLPGEAEEWAEFVATSGLAELEGWYAEPAADESPKSYDLAPGVHAATVLSTVDFDSLSSYDLIDSVKSLGRLASWSQAMQARALATFAYRRPTSGLYDTGFRRSESVSRFAADEISCALGMTRRGAEDRLGVALQLSDALPDTLDALQRGALDWSKVCVISDAVSVLPADEAHLVEQKILPSADGKTTGQLRRAATRAAIAINPAAANARHEEARLRREVVVRPLDEGMSSLQAYLCAEEAALAHSVLTRIATSAPKDDPRTLGQRRSDALIDLITGRINGSQTDGASRTESTETVHVTNPGGATGTSAEVRLSRPIGAVPGVGKPLVHVVVGAGTLAGVDDKPAELVGHGPIPADVARRIAADGTWRRILTDPATGAVLDVGRTRYRPPAALADYVRARDRVCVFPPCQRAAHDCDLDHQRRYSRGGGTSPPVNLGPLCGQDHMLKETTGWSITRRGGTVTWTSPTGHRYANSAEDYREFTGTASGTATATCTAPLSETPDDELPPF